MSENDRLIQQAERAGSLRRLFLAGQAVAYIGWIGSQGAAHIPALNINPLVLDLIQTVCWPIWLVNLLATFWLMRRTAKNRQVSALLDDERTVGLTRTVFQAGYWVLLMAVALVYAATFLIEVDIRAIAPILLSLGVAVPSLTYACLYRS